MGQQGLRRIPAPSIATPNSDLLTLVFYHPDKADLPDQAHVLF